MNRFLVTVFLSLIILAFTTPSYAAVRFYGTGTNRVDRIEIPIDNPGRPADVGATDFTIEFWMKATSDSNTSGTCSNTNDGWITGHIIIDRDIYNAGDLGDFGISLTSTGNICFGASRGSTGNTIISNGVNVKDGKWHHVAVTRALTDGKSRLYIDGVQRASGETASGDIGYRNGRSTTYENDPFLVFGAEKHDAGSSYPSFNGFLDDVRISRNIRYTSTFNRPNTTLTTDANTAALYPLDGTAGACTGIVADTSGVSGGPSNGSCLYGGGTNKGPLYVTDSPYIGGPPTATPPTSTTTVIPTMTPSKTPTPRISPSTSASPTSQVTPTRGPSPTLQPNCPNKKYGDADCNNLINNEDFNIWKDEYIMQRTSRRANFNFAVDDKVSLVDLEIWMRGFLVGIPGTPTIAVTPVITTTQIPSISKSPTPIRTPTVTLMPTSPPGSAQYPAQVLNLTNWKITLPTGSSGAEEIKQPALATFRVDPWFVVNPGGGVRFRAPVGINGQTVTTGGSSYPRSELREMVNNGKDGASWSSGSGVHTMIIDQAITALPLTKKHVVAGQIHDADDDVIVFRLEGKRLFVNTDGPDFTLTENYNLGDRFTVKFEVSGNQTRAYYNNMSTPVFTYSRSYSGAYFKAGAYTQSNCSTEGSANCQASNYGEVIIYGLQVTHQ